MTNKVYCVRYRFLSLVLLVSKPLKTYLKRLSFCLPTGMTTKVYPIRQTLASQKGLPKKICVAKIFWEKEQPIEKYCLLLLVIG